MKIKNKRILALLGRASFVVVVCAMNCYADATTDKQAYLDGTRRELVGGFQLPPDIVGVQREATLVSGTGTLAVFDVVTTITDATNTAGVVSGPYEAPFVNNSIDEVPYLDGISDERNIVINMEGGSVGQLWGAYYYSDVPNGKITHNVSGGLVDYLVGGVNLTDSTNVRPGFTPGQVQGVEINISGGNVGQIRGGNSTSEGELAAAQHIGSGGVSINISGGVIGKEGQQDAIRGAGGSYDGVEGKVSVNISGDAEIVGDVYAGARQAKVDSTEVHISGGTIQGDVYAGGSYGGVPSVVAHDTLIQISGGAVNGDVYAGGMNDRVEGNTTIVLTGSTASISGSLNGGSNNSAAAAAGSVGGSKSVELGTAEAAYTGTVRLADFNEVNVNRGSATIESLQNAAEGTNVTVAAAGTLNARAGVLAGLNRLDVDGGTLNIDMQGGNATGVSGKSLTLADGSTINVTNVAEDDGRVDLFGFDDVENVGDIALTLNGGAVSANMWDLANGVLIIKELNPVNLSLSRNQSRFYNALLAMRADGKASSDLENLLSSRDEAAVKAQLDALSGHEYATSMSSQIDGNMGHLRRLRASMGKGVPLQLGSVFVEAAVDSKSGNVTEIAAITDPRRWRFGVQGFYEESDIDSDRHGDGYDRTEAGAMLSAEYLVSNGVVFGGALSYGRTSLRTHHARTQHEDNTRFDFYSLCNNQRWNFATSIGMGLHTHHLRRFQTGTADADGCAINFMHETSFDVVRSEYGNMQVYGGVETSWNRMDGIRESGADYNLHLRKQDAWATDVNMGVRFNMGLPSMGNAPGGMFSVQTGAVGSVGDVNPAARLDLNGYDYRQECATRDRWGWEIGAGLDVPVSGNVSLFGTAEGIIRSDSHSFDGQIGMRVTF